MNTLMYGNTLLLGKETNTSMKKSSGSRTPAPTSKVLRWKDLEAATAEVARDRSRIVRISDLGSVRSVNGSDDGQVKGQGGEEDEGQVGGIGEREEEEVEEMFV